MFKKILIANRGEIACRIISTCKKLSIPTVAVYSDADARALHVKLADEAINIGPPPSTESYLSIDKIISACKQTNADAVHPGYGFLSENHLFMSRLEKEDITFIGPSAEPIRVMGDKIESKIFAIDAGVNTVPGYQDIIKTSEDPSEEVPFRGSIIKSITEAIEGRDTVNVGDIWYRLRLNGVGDLHSLDNSGTKMRLGLHMASDKVALQYMVNIFVNETGIELKPHADWDQLDVID